jgi:hypothetical protein
VVCEVVDDLARFEVVTMLADLRLAQRAEDWSRQYDVVALPDEQIRRFNVDRPRRWPKPLSHDGDPISWHMANLVRGPSRAADIAHAQPGPGRPSTPLSLPSGLRGHRLRPPAEPPIPIMIEWNEANAGATGLHAGGGQCGGWP